jgi:hypothetical protein
MGYSLLVRHPLLASLDIHLAQPVRIRGAYIVQTKTYSDIRDTAATYNEHLSKLHVQIRDLTAEHHLIIDEKDSAIAKLRREVDGLKTQNTAISCDLAAESDSRKSAAVCAKNLTIQHDIKDKEIVKLENEVTELESKLVEEKVKSTADKGAKEKLLSMTKK